MKLRSGNYKSTHDVQNQITLRGGKKINVTGKEKYKGNWGNEAVEIVVYSGIEIAKVLSSFYRAWGGGFGNCGVVGGERVGGDRYSKIGA